MNIWWVRNNNDWVFIYLSNYALKPLSRTSMSLFLCSPLMSQKNIQILKIILILNLIFICEAKWFDTKAAKEGALTTVELAKKYGYPIDEHTVSTEDGVKLRLHRIPYGRNNVLKEDEPPRQAVLLMHGILCSSDIWLLMGPEKGLGFILADQNFDVWLGNFRGSRYSNKLLQKGKNTAYWNSSWHEMGIYDYPAFIDKILTTKVEERRNERDGSQRLIVFGHSMGTTAYYVLVSEKPSYVKEKVQIMISFAPVAFRSHIKSPIHRFLYGPVAKMMMALRVNGLDGKFLRGVGRWLVLEKILVRRIYEHTLFLISGYNYGQLDKSTLPKIFGHIPAGSTTKSLSHYGQLVKSGEFRQYDYGSEKNTIIYKQKKPLDYKLDNNPVPIVLCYGSNDWLSQKEDLEKLLKGLRKGTAEIGLLKIDDDKFNHMDFVFAKDVVTLLYNPIIDVIKNYASSKTLKGNKLLQWTI